MAMIGIIGAETTTIIGAVMLRVFMNLISITGEAPTGGMARMRGVTAGGGCLTAFGIGTRRRFIRIPTPIVLPWLWPRVHRPLALCGIIAGIRKAIILTWLRAPCRGSP